MREYGFGTFDTDVHCEELLGAEEHLLASNPELFADPLELMEDIMGEELTLP